MCCRTFQATAVLAFFSCVPPQSGLLTEGDMPVAGDTDTVIPLCVPTLSLESDLEAINPFGLTTLRAQGGTGEYVFSIVDPGAIGAGTSVLNGSTGVFLAGEDIGTIDFRVEDSGCTGEALASVRIVSPMQARPERAELLPAASFTIEVLSGGGIFEFSMLEAGSGGSLTLDGLYTGGAQNGRDLIEVTDKLTGEQVILTYTIDNTTTMRFVPAEIMVPVGERIKPVILGGTGYIEVVFSGQGVRFSKDTGEFTVDSGTLVTATATDRFSGQTATLSFAGVEPLVFTAMPFGDRTRQSPFAFERVIAGSARKPVDINADGFADIIYGHPEADLNGLNSGAVYIYLGSSTGFPTTPSRILQGADREDKFGWSLAAADFDGDGRVDLAVGAEFADQGATRNGAVHIYYGEEGRVFSELPRTTFAGAFAYASLGSALSACDYNGDGLLDLAVAARTDENREMDVVSDQGAVHIYLGYAGGFLGRPDMTAWGVVPDTATVGAWTAVRALQVGWAMDSGDINGDGLCDLVVSSIERRSTPQRRNDGAVFLYSGQAPESLFAGGIASVPTRVIAEATGLSGSQFGRTVAVADLDADGKAEVIVGQPWAEVGTLNNAGTVWVYPGVAFSSTPSTQVEALADQGVKYPGTQANAYFGWYLDVARLGDNGPFDLFVGAPAQDPKGALDDGAFHGFPGSTGALPSETPAFSATGLFDGDNFGQALRSIGDIDGDNQLDFVVAAGFGDEFNNTDEIIGLDVGALNVWSSTGTSGTVFALGAVAAGQRFGESLAFLGDVNNDGRADILVGASRSTGDWVNRYRRGVLMGAGYLYLGQTSGVLSAPLKIGGYPGHTDGEQLGWRVAAAGDFNNDGINDFAMVSRYDSQPTTFSGYDNADGCPTGYKGGVGSLTIYLGSSDSAELIRPDFIYWGQQIGQRLDAMTGDFDFDGDGFSDIALGSTVHDGPGVRVNNGALYVVRGRAAPAVGVTQILCDEAAQFFGAADNIQFGFELVALGDLDDDGCDELAVSAYRESLTGATRVSAQGTVRLLYGSGAGCGTMGRVVTLASGVSSSNAGWSLAAGNLDTDPKRELAIGLPRDRPVQASTGSVVILPGTYLAGLATTGSVGADDVVPSDKSVRFISGDLSGTFSVSGRVVDDYFGQSVAMVGSAAEGTAALVVGGSRMDMGGADSGGALVYRYYYGENGFSDGLDMTPVAAFTGQASNPRGQLGDSVAAGIFNGVPAVLVGGYWATGATVDSGAAFILFPSL